MLDDVTNTVPIPEIIDWARATAGHGMSIVASVQDVDHAVDVWSGVNINTALGSFQNILQLSSVTEGAAVYLSGRGGAFHQMGFTPQTTRIKSVAEVSVGPAQHRSFFYTSTPAGAGVFDVTLTSAIHHDAWLRMLTSEMFRISQHDRRWRVAFPAPDLTSRNFDNPQTHGAYMTAVDLLEQYGDYVAQQGGRVWKNWRTSRDRPFIASPANVEERQQSRLRNNGDDYRSL